MMALGWELLLLISLAGGVGAVVRFVLDAAVQYRQARRSSAEEFPWGLWLVNISGSLVIGFIAGLVSAQNSVPAWASIVMTGFLGGYTTFSSASYDTVRLLREGRLFAGICNGFAMLVAALVMVSFGFWLGENF